MTSERDFEVGNRKFKLNKIDAFKQFHIVRRIGPILSELIPVAQKLSKLSAEQMNESQFESIAPILTGISKLSDEDANKVLLGLCSAVEMFQPASNSWSRVATDAGLMFHDLEFPTLLQIAGRAFQYNMAGFFAALPQK
jgi:hypothetical protein